MKGFKELLEECREFVADDPDYYGLELSTKEVRLIVEALEKQIAKSYDIRNNTSGVFFYCPECGVKIDSYDNYCFNCGQRIDWRW